MLDPPARIEAAADVDLVVGDVLDHVNRWSRKQIGGGIEDPSILGPSSWEKTLEKVDLPLLKP